MPAAARRGGSLLLLLLAAWCVPTSAAAQDGAPDPAAGPPAVRGAASGQGSAADPDDETWWKQQAPDPAALRADPAAHAELLERHGLLLDLDGGAVSMRGAVLHDRRTLGYPVEYLVVNEHGKTHEALILVRAVPSFLDACLKALELQPGAPTLVELADPLPPEADIAAGLASPWEVRPGHGPLVSIQVAWTDDVGARHEVELEQLLLDVRTEAPLPVAGWVYVGSRQGPLRQGREVVDVFMADLEGNIAAIYLDGRGTSLFERNSLEGLDDSLYTLDTERMPARETRVTLTFRATGGSVDPPPADPASAGPDKPVEQDEPVEPAEPAPADG